MTMIIDTNYCRPICLPSPINVNYTGLDVVGTVTGWGTTLITYTSNSKGRLD